MSEPGMSADSRLRVFVSYSRKDEDFARELVAGLQATRFEPYLDQHDIAAGEDWETRLGRLIGSADTVVFVISPDAVTSERCAWEVECAQVLGKRLLPVVWRSVAEANVPERLQRLNYIFFDKPHSFGPSPSALATALRTDIDWIREHTRYGEVALRWEARSRADALLLRGEELAAAKSWISDQPRYAPEPTLLTQEFIKASQDAEVARASTERQRLEQVAAAQAERAKALEAAEAALHNERKAQHKAVRWQRRLIWSGAVTIMVLTGIGWWAYGIISEQRAIAKEANRDDIRGQIVTYAVSEGEIALDVAKGQEKYTTSPYSTAISQTLRQRGKNLVDAFIAAHQRVTAAASVVVLDTHFQHSPNGNSQRPVVTVSAIRQRALLADVANVGRIWDLQSGAMIARLQGHSGKISGADFAPDGLRVVTASADATARVWDTESGKQTALLKGHAGFVDTAQFSPNGRWIVTASGDRTARIWDSVNGRQIAELKGHAGAVHSAMFSSDGRRVVTASADTTARVWDVETGKQIAEMRGHKDGVRSARFSADGRRVLTASADKTARVWNAETGEQTSQLAGHGGPLRSATFSPDSRRAVTVSDEHTSRIWDVEGEKQIAHLAGHSRAVDSAVYSPDGRRVLTSSATEVGVWDAESGKNMVIFPRLMGDTIGIALAIYSPDGRWIIAPSFPEAARVWDAETFKQHAVLDLVPVRSINFNRDGTRIVSMHSFDQVRVWNSEAGKQIEVIRNEPFVIYSADFGPSGLRLIIPSERDSLQIWEPETARRISFSAESLGFRAQFSSDGRLMLTTEGNKLRLRDAASGAEVRQLQQFNPKEGGCDAVRAEFSSDGSRIVASTICPGEPRIVVLDTSTGNRILALEDANTGTVSSLQFSPDGQRIVVAAAGKQAWIFDTGNGKLIRELEGHAGTVESAAYSPDGSRIVTASDDGTARIWDAATFKEIVVLNGHVDAVLSAAFSPDGKRVATGSIDATLRIWDSASGEQLAVLRTAQ